MNVVSLSEYLTVPHTQAAETGRFNGTGKHRSLSGDGARSCGLSSCRPSSSQQLHYNPHFTDEEMGSTGWGCAFRLTQGVANSPDSPGMRTQTLRCRTFSVKTGTVLRELGWLVTLHRERVTSRKHLQYTELSQSELLRGREGCPNWSVGGRKSPHIWPWGASFPSLTWLSQRSTHQVLRTLM